MSLDLCRTFTNIFQVKVAFYKESKEVAYVVFNGTGLNYNDSDLHVYENHTDLTGWFDCSRIVESSWKDLESDIPPAICSMKRYYRKNSKNWDT